jgi:hypothetical protein
MKEDTMSRNLKLATVSLAGAVLAACATTTFNSTWKAPDAKPLNFEGKKVAALVMSKDDSVRLGAEDALAREITAQGAVGVAAYTIIPKEAGRDQAKAHELLDKAGVVGVVSMRVVGKEKEISGSGPSYWGAPGYGHFYGAGYYGYGWGGVYDPGYLRTDTIVSVETLIYSLEQDKLIWAGRSQTTSPSDVNSFIKELCGKAAEELKKEGLVKKEK